MDHPGGLNHAGNATPLILLDVDGPLHPWAAGSCPPGYRQVRGMRRRHRVWLNPAHGPALLDLASRADAQLAWASSWGHNANAVIGPAIGLPPLPVVEFAGPHDDTLPAWKYPAVARFAYGRPLVWFDDDFGMRPAERDAFVDRRGAVGTTLVSVDPREGITDADLRFAEGVLRN